MFRGGSSFDKLLDKATSHTNLEPDITTIIQISDVIRQGDCQPKYALAAIKKKLFNANWHTVHYALLVLESLVKNCGHVVHDEIATKTFLETLRDVLKSANNQTIKDKTLEMLQAWEHAFRTTPKYKAVQEMVARLKSEGCTFPSLKESDAMFSAETAPDWVDSNTCHRCRVAFGLVQRKHHCRACGNVFCAQCSSKTSNIPKFGIEKEVRVCETCYEQNKRSTSPKVEVEQLPVEYLNSSLAQQKQSPKQKTAEELKEEEEFDLALALSQSEAEAKELERKRQPVSDVSKSFQSMKLTSPIRKEDEEQDDEELSRYLNRNHWEQRADKTRSGSPERRNSPPSAPETPTHQMENGLSDSQFNDFVQYLRSQVEIFVNRMKSNSSRGRSISNDSSVQSLFLNMADSHSKLLHQISQQEEVRLYFERLQDKLAQVKDAVAALDDLRNEHQEKLRIEAEEAERVKQQQMAYKLQIMRKKKQEYLQQQRVLALQRLQEEEREMMMRKHQQSYMMGYPQGHPPGYPGQVPQYMPQGYPSPMHQGMAPHMQGTLPPHMQAPQPHPQMQGPQHAHMQGPQHPHMPGLHMQGPQQQHANIQGHQPHLSNMQGPQPHLSNMQGPQPQMTHMQGPPSLQPHMPGGLPPQSLPHMGPPMHNPMGSQTVQSLGPIMNPGPMHPNPGMMAMPAASNPGQMPQGNMQSGPPMQQGNMQQPMTSMQHHPYPGMLPNNMMPGAPVQQFQQHQPKDDSTAEFIRFD